MTATTLRRPLAGVRNLSPEQRDYILHAVGRATGLATEPSADSGHLRYRVTDALTTFEFVATASQLNNTDGWRLARARLILLAVGTLGFHAPNLLPGAGA